MIKVTVDTNIVIKALKPIEINYELVQQLINWHKNKVIQLQVVAAIASENGRSLEGNKRALLTDLETLGISDAEILAIPAFIDMSYVGLSYLVDEDSIELQRKIWSTVFGVVPFEHDAFCKFNGINIPDENYIDKKWRNYRCDVLTVLEYINSRNRTSSNDLLIFVTADNDDILKHASKLEEFGASNILSLSQAIEKIESIIS